MKDLVSVLLPCYNAAKYINIAINSILIQTYNNFELLICDDASTDNTLDIVKEIRDDRIQIFTNLNNHGYLKTCNFLFPMAKGEFITFQDADDWSSDNRIFKQLMAFNCEKDLSLCGTYADYFIGTRKVAEKRPSSNYTDIKNDIRTKNQFCGASVMIRRNVYEKIGGYREYFDRIGNENYDWTSRIVEKYKAYNIPELLYHINITKNSASRKIVSPKQIVSADIVKCLIIERLSKGKDSIEAEDNKGIQNIENKLLNMFKQDPSLIHRRSADISYFTYNYEQFLYSSIRAVFTRPTNFINYKYVMKSILILIKYIVNFKIFDLK